jgi:hypothetical protein
MGSVTTPVTNTFDGENTLMSREVKYKNIPLKWGRPYINVYLYMGVSLYKCENGMYSINNTMGYSKTYRW